REVDDHVRARGDLPGDQPVVEDRSHDPRPLVPVVDAHLLGDPFSPLPRQALGEGIPEEGVLPEVLPGAVDRRPDRRIRDVTDPVLAGRHRSAPSTAKDNGTSKAASRSAKLWY